MMVWKIFVAFEMVPLSHWHDSLAYVEIPGSKITGRPFVFRSVAWQLGNSTCTKSDLSHVYLSDGKVMYNSITFRSKSCITITGFVFGYFKMFNWLDKLSFIWQFLVDEFFFRQVQHFFVWQVTGGAAILKHGDFVEWNDGWHPVCWCLLEKTITRWWFQTFFILIPTWGRFQIWLICFKGVETTNYYSGRLMFVGKNDNHVSLDIQSYLLRFGVWGRYFFVGSKYRTSGGVFGCL